MQRALLSRSMGIILGIYVIAILPVLVMAWYQSDVWLSSWLRLASSLSVLALCLYGLGRRAKNQDMKLKTGVILVVFSWLILSLLCGLPFVWFSGQWIDGLFEGISGLTTTGAEVFTQIDSWPVTWQFYHQWLQWLGGMGVVILAIALFPLLGVGGTQLYQADIPGPIKDNKMTPSIAGTAKALWMIYVIMTAVCTISYHLGGMSSFEAFAQAMSTVSTGGFSIHDQSFGYYKQPSLRWISMFFMVLSALRFALHYRFFVDKQMQVYWQDDETCVWFRIMGYALFITVAILVLYAHFPALSSTMEQAFFAVISTLTTTGFRSDDFANWPIFLPVMLSMLAMIGGAMGSTSGGMKCFRVMLVAKEIKRTLQIMIHPRGVFAVHFNAKAVSEDILSSSRGFVSLYIMLYFIFQLSLMACHLSWSDAMVAAMACLTNLGAGIGAISSHYGDLSVGAKSLLMLAMLIGRLEIMTCLVLFMPSFWRRY